MILQLQSVLLKRFLYIVGSLLFIIYLLYLSYLLFFAYYRQSVTILNYNYVPFSTINLYFSMLANGYFYAWFTNICGNILAFLPFGFLVSLLFKHFYLVKMLFTSCMVSLLVESLQSSFRIGSFDVDDIILNTIGGLCGYFIARIFIMTMKRVDQVNCS
ncbi:MULTISPECIES: VanZ family protein [Bacillaceae]|uniref:Glycopeptide antibiotics resistance protein n=1 Tax=Peribacillus huizhouensis TaxID=1501239 RepID=A0ABR6CPS8_9BACI|nr:glycopeptide antibiotics resistance protein [Peribacillus huizhouensis]